MTLMNFLACALTSLLGGAIVGGIVCLIITGRDVDNFLHLFPAFTIGFFALILVYFIGKPGIAYNLAANAPIEEYEKIGTYSPDEYQNMCSDEILSKGHSSYPDLAKNCDHERIIEKNDATQGNEYVELYKYKGIFYSDYYKCIYHQSSSDE